MSDTDSDSFVTVYTPLYSGSSISEDPLKTPGVYPSSTPHTEVENQLSEIPDDWKPPSEFFARLFFTIRCLFILGRFNLEEVWQVVREEPENGWKKCHGLHRAVVGYSVAVSYIVDLPSHSVLQG